LNFNKEGLSRENLIGNGLKSSVRAQSQECIQTKLILDENFGYKFLDYQVILFIVRDHAEKPSSFHKKYFLNTFKNCTPSKNDIAFEKDSSIINTPTSITQSNSNSQQLTPAEKNVYKRTQISPFRREFLKRNFVETQQKITQIKPDSQLNNNLTLLSVCTPQQSKVNSHKFFFSLGF